MSFATVLRLAAHLGDTTGAPDPDNGDFYALSDQIVAAQVQTPVKERLGNGTMDVVVVHESKYRTGGGKPSMGKTRDGT